MARERTVRVTLTGDAKDLQRAFGTANAAARDFKKVLVGIVGAAGIGALVTSFKRGATAAIDLARDFETSMAKIVGLVGIAKESVEEMEESVLDLAGETAKSPQELADALFFVTSAGLRGQTAMDVLEQSARAAAAGLGETKDVALAVTGTINAYGRENLSAAEATDILVNTIRLGNVEAADIAPVLGRIVPIASQVGVSFDQVGAAIAAITRLGGNANETITSLRGIFRAIIKPSKEAEKVFRDYGTSAAGIRQQLREEGLLATLQTLNDIFGENEEALTKVFGRIQGLVGFLALMGGNVEDNVMIFREMANSTGVLDEAFQAMAETSSFKLEQAMIDIKTQATELALDALPGIADMIERLLPLISNIIEGMAGFAEGLVVIADYIINLDPAAQTAIAALGLLAVALTAFVGHPVIAAFAAIAAGIQVIGSYSRENRTEVQLLYEDLKNLGTLQPDTVMTVIGKIPEKDKERLDALGITVQELISHLEAGTAGGGDALAQRIAASRKEAGLSRGAVAELVNALNHLQNQYNDAAAAVEAETEAQEQAERQAARTEQGYRKEAIEARNLAIAQGVASDELLYGADANEELGDSADEAAGEIEGFAGDVQNLAQDLEDAREKQENLSETLKKAADPVFNLISTFGDYQETLEDVNEDGKLTAEEQIKIAESGLDLAIAFDEVNKQVGGASEAITIMSEVLGISEGDVRSLLGELGIFVDAAGNVGPGIRDGIIGGLDGLGRRMADKMSGEINSAIGQVKGQFRIQSPSRVFADELGYPISEGVAEGILEGMDEAQDALSELTDTLREQAEDDLDSIMGAVSNALSIRGAEMSVEDAERELFELREERSALPGEIEAAERRLEAARRASLEVTLEEQLAIERATEAYERAQQEYDEGEISITELQLAKQRLTEAISESTEMTREYEDAGEDLADLLERQREIDREVEEAEIDLAEAKLRLIEQQQELIESGGELIGVSDESKDAFRRLAEAAGFTESEIADLTTAMFDAIDAYEEFDAVVIGGPGTPGPTGPGTAGTYTVVSGDTMSKIARQHGVTLAQLISANPQIADPNLIYPGQSINIPALARGGIITAPTFAQLGEGGDDEAVIPLNSQGVGMLIDVFTAAFRNVLNEAQFTPSRPVRETGPIIVELHVDGEKLAETTVDRMATQLRRRDEALL